MTYKEVYNYKNGMTKQAGIGNLLARLGNKVTLAAGRGTAKDLLKGTMAAGAEPSKSMILDLLKLLKGDGLSSKLYNTLGFGGSAQAIQNVMDAQHTSPKFMKLLAAMVNNPKTVGGITAGAGAAGLAGVGAGAYGLLGGGDKE